VRSYKPKAPVLRRGYRCGIREMTLAVPQAPAGPTRITFRRWGRGGTQLLKSSLSHRALSARLGSSPVANYFLIPSGNRSACPQTLVPLPLAELPQPYGNISFSFCRVESGNRAILGPRRDKSESDLWRSFTPPKRTSIKIIHFNDRLVNTKFENYS
jgi:hypothetical protein